jgi:hypothetical protein
MISVEKGLTNDSFHDMIFDNTETNRQDKGGEAMPFASLIVVLLISVLLIVEEP